MNPQAATVAFAIGILALFVLDRDPKARTTFALWIPIVWLSIGGSRVVSQWLDPTVGPQPVHTLLHTWKETLSTALFRQYS